MQLTPVRMVGTPSRTVAITLLLLLIGCGLGGGGFLYVHNSNTLFPHFVQATLIIPPDENDKDDDTDALQEEVPGHPSPEVSEGGRPVPQSPPLISETTFPSLSSSDDRRPPSFDALPDYPDLKPLPDIVQPEALIEPTASGSRLPIVDAQGRSPWQVYSRPFHLPHDAVPIAVVVRNLGLNRKATETAIHKLPSEVTLSFSFGSLFLDNDLQTARAAGHETLLELPLEPANYPVSDPGPDTMLTSLPFELNEKRLNLTLGRGVGYVGVMAPSTTRYSESPQMRDLLDVLNRRGLLFVGDLSGVTIPQGMPTTGILQEIDQKPLRTAIDAALTQVVETVETTGQHAVITLSATPLALERLLQWTRLIENNPRIVIAPVSEIVRSHPEASPVLTPQNTPEGVVPPAPQ